MKNIGSILSRCLKAVVVAALFIQMSITPALATFTPGVTAMVVMSEGGGIFPTPAGWIDSLQCSSTASSINLTTVRTNMALPAGLPLFAVFSADGPFWANFNATAVIPVGSTTNGSASEFSPNQRYLATNITAISFVCAANQNISIQFYRP